MNHEEVGAEELNDYMDSLEKEIIQLEQENRELKAQVEQLRDTSWSAFGDGWYEGFLHYAKLCGDSNYVDEAMRLSELAESDSVYGKPNATPKRLAERDADLYLKGWREGGDSKNRVDMIYYDLEGQECANKLRQQVKP